MISTSAEVENLEKSATASKRKSAEALRALLSTTQTGMTEDTIDQLGSRERSEAGNRAKPPEPSHPSQAAREFRGRDFGKVRFALTQSGKEYFASGSLCLLLFRGPHRARLNSSSAAR
jgi:hypothetical protein